MVPSSNAAEAIHGVERRKSQHYREVP